LDVVAHERHLLSWLFIFEDRRQGQLVCGYRTARRTAVISVQSFTGGKPYVVADCISTAHEGRSVIKIVPPHTRACHAAIAARGAAAAIPPRKNGKPWKELTAGATARNDALRSCRRLGRAIWKR
jgi:hypothetical protein